MIQMFSGLDGSSLLCSCGYHAYVTPSTLGFVGCYACGGVYPWAPKAVACANPRHNGPGACKNPACWKAKKK